MVVYGIIYLIVDDTAYQERVAMKSSVKLSRKDKEKIRKEISDLKEKSRFNQSKQHIQHGKTSVYLHCISVACLSIWIARTCGIKVHDKDLIRGALLHDYFLYDWHDKEPSHMLHGFFHPRTAYENAREDVVLSELETDIIVKHMFPLTVIPPMCRESAIVCVADKICSSQETVEGFKLRLCDGIKKMTSVISAYH